MFVSRMGYLLTFYPCVMEELMKCEIYYRLYCCLKLFTRHYYTMCMKNKAYSYKQSRETHYLCCIIKPKMYLLDAKYTDLSNRLYIVLCIYMSKYSKPLSAVHCCFNSHFSCRVTDMLTCHV